tara:strand:- start:901 stop:1056 length:156 start_codon:yes stop_codon:yes gene_type:complete
MWKRDLTKTVPLLNNDGTVPVRLKASYLLVNPTSPTSTAIFEIIFLKKLIF